MQKRVANRNYGEKIMSKNKGRTCSLYLNAKEIEGLEIEAIDIGIEPKELLKAKAVAKNNVVSVVHKFDIGNEVKENLFDIASFLLSIRGSLDAANDEFLMPEDITILRENSDKALTMFSDALTDMRAQVAKQHAG